MKLFIKFFLVLGTLASILIFWSGCSSQTLSSKDRNVDLSKYRTYKWISESDADYLNLHNPNYKYPIAYMTVERKPAFEEKVRARVEEDLDNRGFTEATTESPDFYVTYYGKAQDQNWVTSWSGRTPNIADVPIVIFPDLNPSQARNHIDGTVYLVFYDARTKKAAWTGKFRNEDFGQNINDTEIATAVDELVSAFQSSA
jgi:uncharacterized protein YceK